MQATNDLPARLYYKYKLVEAFLLVGATWKVNMLTSTPTTHDVSSVLSRVIFLARSRCWWYDPVYNICLLQNHCILFDLRMTI